MIVVLDNEETSLDRKVEEIASRYIDLIIKEPEIPTFIVTEIRNNPNMLLEKLPIKQVLAHSVFFKQHKMAVENGQISEPNPLHFLMNVMGLVIFPFIGKPLLMGGSGINDSEFTTLMTERKN